MNDKDTSDNFFDDDLFDEPVKKHSLLTIAAIFLACAGLIGTAWYIYDSYREKNDDEMLLITAQAEEIKVEPIDPGGMVVDNMDKSVYDSLESTAEKETKIETLLLPSEEPLDKKTLVETESVVIKNEDENPTVNNITIVNEGVPTPTPELNIPAPEIKIKASATEEEYIKPVAVKTKAAPKFAKKNESFYKVQIASFKSKAEADKHWSMITRKFSSIFENSKHYIVTKDIEGKGMFYRLQVGPYVDADEAKAACSKFKDAGLNCFIIKP